MIHLQSSQYRRKQFLPKIRNENRGKKIIKKPRKYQHKIGKNEKK